MSPSINCIFMLFCLLVSIGLTSTDSYNIIKNKYVTIEQADHLYVSITVTVSLCIIL